MMEKKKILILLMSCNQPLYLSEEQACCDTFLKDAEGAGLSYWFYKGLDETHTASCVDEATHTIYLNVNDNLGATARKTALALNLADALDFDYLIKTNVSTYLNINNIVKALDNWEGREDTNIYGGRFLINNASKNVPFPRGYFTILSKKLVSGMKGYAYNLSKSSAMPRTDDTLISLCLLYHVKKDLGEDYVRKLMQVPSVTAWHDDIEEDPNFENAMAIRCKNERDKERTTDNMRKVHELLHPETPLTLKHYTPATQFETGYGTMEYNSYLRLEALLQMVKEPTKKEKDPESPST